MQKIYKILANLKHQFLFTLFGFSPSCHQNPSCSKYTASQIKKNGTIIGLAQGMWRILNCRHF